MKKYLYIVGIFTGVLTMTTSANAMESILVGDINRDSAVNRADVNLLLSVWGPCPADTVCRADVNVDGTVDGADLGIVLGNFTAPQKTEQVMAETETKTETRARITDAELQKIYTEPTLSATAKERVRTAVSADGSARVEREAKKPEAHQNLEKIFSLIQARLRASIANLTNVISRIESRVKALQADGLDTGSAEKFVAQAKTELQTAKSLFDKLPTVFNDSFSEGKSVSVRGADSLIEVRVTVKEIKGHLVSARKNLVDAVGQLKQLK